MSFKCFKLNGLQLLTHISNGDFYCHDEIYDRSYYENVTQYDLERRVRKLNKRINFPIHALYEALYECQPVAAMFSTEQKNGAPTEADLVLRLKYWVKDASLKWEWHLKSVNTAEFYRRWVMLTISDTISLGNSQEYLMGIITQKDREILQYRNEGALLRRTTVATKLFDVNGFWKQNKSLLNNVDSYGKCVPAFGGSVISFSPQPSAMESPNGTSAEPADVATTTKSNTTYMGASNTLSPRNRKRKAMEADEEHVKRMALQRRRMIKSDNIYCDALVEPEAVSEDEKEEAPLPSPKIKPAYNGQENNLDSIYTVTNPVVDSTDNGGDNLNTNLSEIMADRYINILSDEDSSSSESQDDSDNESPPKQPSSSEKEDTDTDTDTDTVSDPILSPMHSPKTEMNNQDQLDDK